MKKLLAYIVPLWVLVPFIGYAAGTGATADLSWFQSIINGVNTLVNTAVPVVFGLAFLMFLWGMFTTFILGGGDEEKQKKGRQLMVYAIIGFVVMLAVWGIVNLILNITGINATGTIPVPKIPGAV